MGNIWNATELTWETEWHDIIIFTYILDLLSVVGTSVAANIGGVLIVLVWFVDCGSAEASVAAADSNMAKFGGVRLADVYV